MYLCMLALRKLIGLGKFEKFYLGEVMMRMEVRKCLWLKAVPSNSLQGTYLAQLYLWIINNLVILLIKVHTIFNTIHVTLSPTCIYSMVFLIHLKNTNSNYYYLKRVG